MFGACLYVFHRIILNYNRWLFNSPRKLKLAALVLTSLTVHLTTFVASLHIRINSIRASFGSSDKVQAMRVIPAGIFLI